MFTFRLTLFLRPENDISMKTPSLLAQDNLSIFCNDQQSRSTEATRIYIGKSPAIVSNQLN